MQTISLPIRLMLLILVAAGVYLGVRQYMASKVVVINELSDETLAKLASSAKARAANPAVRPTPAAAAGIAASPATGAAKRPTFNYLPAEPTGGKLRGVVELGASGFNSFIVRTDAQHHWKLHKAEFDNSLLMENMASKEEIRRGLRAYIAKMLDYGVAGRDIHFVVSSGALKAPLTAEITKQLRDMGYVVNAMTNDKEATLGLSVALPPAYQGKAFMVDMGSGSTEIAWLANGAPASVNSYGAKYYEQGVDDQKVAAEIKRKAAQVPAGLRQTCFIIGGVPYEMAKQVRQGKERYTVLDAPSAYQFDKAKAIAGLNIYRALAEATGCKQFVFDWDANFTIGYLLSLPQ